MKLVNLKINPWFGLSLLFALYYSLISLHFGLSQDYLVQDDVRIHLVWLQRFNDPELFPNDFIADYFVYFAPWGLKATYWLGAKLGIEPLVLAKVLPAPLGIVTAIYTYFWSLAILPRHFTAFLSSLMISQLIWTNDDLISATPRAFIYPLLAAFFYYLTKKNLPACLLSMLLMGLFYPQVLLVEVAILAIRLIDRQSKFYLCWDKAKYYWLCWGLIIAAIALFPYTLRDPQWVTVTAEQMRDLPEFNAGGRSYFYGMGWVRFFFAGDSGLCLPNFPPIIWLGFALPWAYKKHLPTIKAINPQIVILWQTVIASLLMFAIAHLLLLKIHLPSRYTYHTLRFVLAIAFAIVLTSGGEIFFKWLKQQDNFRLKAKLLIIVLVSFLTIAVVFPLIPLAVNGWMQNWRGSKQVAIYQYLAKQPKDTLVASLSNQANNIPAFSLRSVLVSREFAFPYHPYYHQEIIERAKATILAQYATTPEPLLQLIQTYGVDYILLDRHAFTPGYLASKKWLVYSSWQDITQDAIAQIERQAAFVLPTLVVDCSVATTEQTHLLSTDCIQQKLLSP